MKLTWMLAVVIASVLLQVTLARYTVGGRWTFDFVLVGVIVVALQWGAVAGMLAGTVGGLLQDVLAGGIVGVGGLTKTLVGFGAGAIGAQFVLVRPHAKMIIVAAGTLVHRLMILGLSAIIEQRWPGVPWGAMLAEMLLNALAAWVVFQATNALPGVIQRQRDSRRPSLGRRRW